MAHKGHIAKLAPVQLLCIGIATLLLGVGLLSSRTGYGDQLPARSLTMNQGTVSANDMYELGFTLPHPQSIGSIKLQFCQEGSLIDTPCTAPIGMDVSHATLSSQAGETGFTVSSISDANTIILTRGTATTQTTNESYTFKNVINPSSSGTFYGRLQTFSSVNASGVETDEGGLALSIADAVRVSATVPPYLYFCVGITIAGVDCSTVTGDYVNFGNFTPILATTAETQMVAGTNGPTGYAITLGGTTLTSGNNIIPGLAIDDVSRPGTSQFGVNLVANNDPQVGQDASGAGNGSAVMGYNQANRYKYVPDDIVAGVLQPDLPRKYTTSYIVNIAKDQAPGIYVSTVTYVATAGF